MATFPVEIGYARSTRYGVDLRSLEMEFGNGYTQSTQDGINSAKQRWRIKTVILDESDADQVEAFLISQTGRSFDWTPPNKTQSIKVACKKYNVEYLGGGVERRLSMEFVERYT